MTDHSKESKKSDPHKDDPKKSDNKMTQSVEDEALLEDATLDVKGLAKALEESKEKAAENWNTYLRARADMDNIQRRAQLDVEKAHKYGVERFAKDMLAVMDCLEQGLQVADSVKDTAYHEGMELTLKLFLDIFDRYGIKQIDPIGESFDPLRHEAISAQMNNDVESNKVLVVAQKGFVLHDRVLRPARVIVSRKES